MRLAQRYAPQERNGSDMNIKLKTSLRVILIGMTVLPLIILGLVSSLQIFGFSSKMIANEAGSTGYAYSSGIDNIVKGYIDDAKALSALNSVQSAVTDLNSVKSDIENLRAGFKKERGYVLDVVILDKEGSIVNDGIGSNAGTYFFAKNDNWDKKQNAFASEIFPANDSYGDSVFVTANKLADGGYVACVVSMNSITDYLAKYTILGSDSFVVADEGSVVGYNGEGVCKADASALSSEIKSMIPSALTESYMNGFGKLEKAGFIGGYGVVEGTDWVWFSLYPASGASDMVFFLFIVAMVVIVALALICMLIMVIMTQNIINPMLDMVRTMKDINSGNREQRIDTKNMKREFARMSETFNDMLDEALLSEELHKTVSDLSDNMLFEYDFAKESMFVSDNFKEKIGLSVSGATLNNGKFIDSMMNEDDTEHYKRDINTLLKNKDDIGGEYLIKDAQGKDMWAAMRAHCITDRLGEILRVIGVLTDITSEKNATLKLAERASYDFLSQLYNRNTFEREFQAELDRNANQKVAALFLDVDDFKFINDRYSHAVGDEVIRYVADVIKKHAGESGFAGRFGGDEFVLCVSDPKMIENLEVLSMDIIDDLYSGYYSKSVDATLNIKASIGIAVSPEHGQDGRTLIACADTAMYFVKKNGKANYHIYDPTDEETTMGAHTL